MQDNGYHVPFKQGEIVRDIGEALEIGEPWAYRGSSVKAGDTGPDAATVPVKFAVGWRLVICLKDKVRGILTSSNPEVDELVRVSTTTPEIRRGIGSDVLHVLVTDPADGKLVLLKLFYNEKAGRRDEVHRE